MVEVCSRFEKVWLAVQPEKMERPKQSVTVVTILPKNLNPAASEGGSSERWENGVSIGVTASYKSNLAPARKNRLAVVYMLVILSVNG
jgi:hypothetical protein